MSLVLANSSTQTEQILTISKGHLIKLDMDSFGVFADGELESFSKMFSNEEFDFSHTQNDAQGLHYITPSNIFPISEANESLFYSSNTTLNSNLHNLSQHSSSFGSNCSSSVFNVPTSTHETYFFTDFSNQIPVTNDVSMFMVDERISSDGMTFPDIIAMEETCPINQYMNGGESQAKELQLKRKFDEPARIHCTGEDDRVLNVTSIETNAKKKARGSRYAKRTNKKNVEESQKSQLNHNVCPKGTEGEESINGGSADGQSSTSTYNSEDDSASQDTNNEESKASLALNLNGKPRASRGSATDPQSLYARKRRERINERLKILQNLVPNGTKVDISTMLEEAVHYVKFMQLQIKLLSSDDLWMYAPLAYNGVDLCLNQKISSFL